MQIISEISLFFRRQRHVTRQIQRQQTEVGIALNIGVTTQGIHAAARHTNVAKQQLDHRRTADGLCAAGMVRPAQRIQNGRGFIARAGFRQNGADQQEIFFRGTAQTFHQFRRVTGNMLFQQVPDTARVLQRFILFREAFFIQLIVPAFFVIGFFRRVKTAEKTVVEFIIFTYQQAGIGVFQDVFGLNFIVGDQIVDHAEQEGRVRTSANRRVDIGHRSTAVKARIDDDDFGVIFGFGLNHPFESDRMRFCRISAHN